MFLYNDDKICEMFRPLRIHFTKVSIVNLTDLHAKTVCVWGQNCILNNYFEPNAPQGGEAHFKERDHLGDVRFDGRLKYYIKMTLSM
jgi:hypothetical protein